MKVIAAPDKFAGTLTAVEAAAAIREGWLARRPTDDVGCFPMSDGGPGFIAALAVGRLLGDAEQVAVPTTDPLGRLVTGTVLIDGADQRVAYVESAQAVGLHLLLPHERDPERTSSAGLAALVAEAVRRRVGRVVVGLGGSATNDGGAGFLTALERADTATPGLMDMLRRTDLVVATDVDNPLLGLSGASAVFGPQKGADREAVARLEGRMQEWVRARPGIAEVANLPGAGAAGGLGAALFWLGGRRASGARVIADAIGLEDAIVTADLVVTGEGLFDATSLRGKVVAAVARAAQEAALPCLVVAGQVAVGQREAAAHGVDAMLAMAELAGSVEAAEAEPSRWLREAARRLAANWGRD